jgi:hypothetical protein
VDFSLQSEDTRVRLVVRDVWIGSLAMDAIHHPGRSFECSFFRMNVDDARVRDFLCYAY